ncbi:MAG: hypothetical protein MI746_16655 [Pseudomonadales bacterium]|nr:hypothetical protein [Pseudomonadales bacterium]
MADALYQDDGTELPSRLQKHLQECSSCREEFAELRKAKSLLEEAGLRRQTFEDIPERASLDDLFDRIHPELDRVDAQRYRDLPQRNWAPWSVAAGAIAASLIIFVTGFVYLSSNPTETPNTVFNQGVSPKLMSYLNRAQVMLMQVANTESADGSVLPIQQTIARDMAFEANMLTGADNSPFASGERKLLRDIEFMLLQIANLDESNMEEGVALLQRFLDENGILFRIRLLEMRDSDLVI